mgnify:CR=1 FL=1
MRNTNLSFNWSTGSRNENAIKVFGKNNIKWEYSHFGELTADFYGIGTFFKVLFEDAGGDIVNIGFED